eukprot:SAG11_NODE_1442_length_4901_cov_2.114952_5_plen_91_part_00
MSEAAVILLSPRCSSSRVHAVALGLRLRCDAGPYDGCDAGVHKPVQQGGEELGERGRDVWVPAVKDATAANVASTLNVFDRAVEYWPRQR